MVVLLEWNCFHSKWKNWHSKAHSQKATRKREKKTHCRWVTLLNLTPSPLSDSPNSVFNSFLMLTHLDFLHLFTTHNVLTISYLTNWFRACWGTLASLRTTTCPAAPPSAAPPWRDEGTSHQNSLSSCEVHNEHRNHVQPTRASFSPDGCQVKRVSQLVVISFQKDDGSCGWVSMYFVWTWKDRSFLFC